jgi:hypothetical protein
MRGRAVGSTTSSPAAIAAPATSRIASANPMPLAAARSIARSRSIVARSWSRSSSIQRPRSRRRPSAPASRSATSRAVNASPSSVTSARKSSSASAPTPPGGRVPIEPVAPGRGGRRCPHVAGIRVTTPAVSSFAVSASSCDASRALQRSGWNSSPLSISSASHGHASAPRRTGASKASSSGFARAPAYSCRAWPSGTCCGVALVESRVVYVARNAKGASSSPRFSARLKWTRPTRCQAAWWDARKAPTPSGHARAADVKAASSKLHRVASSSGVTYSPPIIGGALAAMMPSSGAGIGVSTSSPRAHTAAT